MPHDTVLVAVAFLLLWIAMPFLWVPMLTVAGVHLGRPTIPSVVIGFILVFQYVGVPVLYFQLDPHRAETVKDPVVMLRVWGVTSVVITLLCAGFLVGRAYAGPLQAFREAHLEPLKRHERIWIVLLGAICVLVLLRYLSMVGLTNVAILSVVGLTEGVDQSVARSLMGNDFAGKYHWYQLFMRDLLLFVVLVQYVQYRISRRTSDLALLLGFGTALVFSLVMAIEKGPTANFIVAVLLINIWLVRDGRLYGRQIAAYAVLLLAILSVTYMAFMGAANVTDALGSIFSRIFTGQLEASYHYLRFFPDQQTWLLGRSLPNPGGFLPFDPYPLTRAVKESVSPELAALGIVGSMPTVFWGELYANAGYVAIFVLTPIIGFVLFLLNRLLFQIPPHPTTLVLFIWMMLHYAELSGTGVSAFLADSNLVALLLTTVVIRTRLA